MNNKALLIGWAGFGACLFALSLTTDVLNLDHPADKMLHLLLNCIFVVGLVFLLKGRLLWLAVAAVLLAGGAVELLQQLVPGRSASMLDFTANAAGVFSGLVIGSLLYRGYYLPQECS